MTMMVRVTMHIRVTRGHQQTCIRHSDSSRRVELVQKSEVFRLRLLIQIPTEPVARGNSSIAPGNLIGRRERASTASVRLLIHVAAHLKCIAAVRRVKIVVVFPRVTAQARNKMSTQTTATQC